MTAIAFYIVTLISGVLIGYSLRPRTKPCNHRNGEILLDLSRFGDKELPRDRIIVEEMYYHCDSCGEQLGRITNHELFVTKENEELLNEARRILR